MRGGGIVRPTPDAFKVVRSFVGTQWRRCAQEAAMGSYATLTMSLHRCFQVSREYSVHTARDERGTSGNVLPCKSQPLTAPPVRGPMRPCTRHFSPGPEPQGPANHVGLPDKGSAGCEQLSAELSSKAAPARETAEGRTPGPQRQRQRGIHWSETKGPPARVPIELTRVLRRNVVRVRGMPS